MNEGISGEKGGATVRFLAHGREILLDLPDAGDHIQKIIAERRTFYEEDMLGDIRGRVPLGGLAIDVGAHVGNHTIFFGAVCGLQVIALEPNPHLFEILRRNVALNGLEKSVRALALAAGETRGRGELAVPDPENLGKGRVLPSTGGETEIIPLDDLDLPGPVSLLKVDVEGCELDVLKGAGEILRRDHPLLYVEAIEDEPFHRIRDFLEPFGYWSVGRFNWTPTYLFMPAGDLPERIAALMASLGLFKNETEGRLDQLEREIDGRLRRMEEEIGEGRFEKASQEIGRLREAVIRIDESVQKEKDRATRHAEALQRRLLELTARLEESEQLRREAERESAEREKKVGGLLRRAVEAEGRARQMEESAALRFGRAIGDFLHHPVSGGIRLPGRLWRIATSVARRKKRRRTETRLGRGEGRGAPSGTLFLDTFDSSWGDWCANQEVKMERGGRLVILQEESTPGVRKNDVAVEPSQAYTLRVAGRFDVANQGAFVRVVDEAGSAPLGPDGQLPGDGEAALTFRTTPETTHVGVYILVGSPHRGDAVLLRSVALATGGEKSASRSVRDMRGEGQAVIASMASIAGREKMLRDAVTSILPSVDKLRVFLNGHEQVPAFLEEEKIEVFRSQVYGDNGDAGKFFRADDNEPGYRIICDDDILYPPDYVDKMIEKVAMYGHHVVVGLHGVLWKQPLRDCYDPDSRHVIHFAGPLSRDRTVHLLGTGTIVYHTSAISLKPEDFPFRNMADIWFALQAKRQKVPLVCVERPDRWLLPGTGPGAGANIFDHSTSGERTALNSSLVQSHVVRTNGPFTIHPARTGVGRREKLVLAVTTFNRREYLQACLESFLETRSTAYDWVVIVADDGSEDGTLEYLEKLRFPHELHVIRNSRRYAVGQTNTIIDLCRSIGFDLGFKVDDDVQFMRPGWDDLYRNAVKLSGWKHLCYLNHNHFLELRRRSNRDFVMPPGHVDASATCVSHIAVEGCMGALFTFTPDVLERVGYGDEENFPIRGQWHIDFSMRCCRAGFNDRRRFFDARNSNEYIELQNNLRADYRCAIDWGDEYQKTKEPEELERRGRILAEEDRVYVGPRRSVAARRGTGIHDVFDGVFVLNLDRRPDRWKAIVHGAEKHGVRIERFAAVDGGEEPHRSEWQAYAEGDLAGLPQGLRPVRNTRDYYLAYETSLARVAYVEQRRRKKAIQSPGAWGYLKSMIALLEKAMREDRERILVLDDDACFHREITRLFPRFLKQVPEDWKILQMGTLQYQWDADWITWHSENVYRCGGSSVGSHAVGLHRSVYPLLLNECLRFQLPYDEGALHHAKRVFRDNAFTFFPNLIIQDTRDSDILSSNVQEREGVKKKNVYRWDLEEYEIPGAPEENVGPFPPAAAAQEGEDLRTL